MATMSTLIANAVREPLPTRQGESRRTTVTLSDRASGILSRFQQATGMSMSEAVSALIENAERTSPRIRMEDGLPIADIPVDGEWISTADVLRAEEELG